jgi:hypothetical protein
MNTLYDRYCVRRLGSFAYISDDFLARAYPFGFGYEFSVAEYRRADYTEADAQEICAWLNDRQGGYAYRPPVANLAAQTETQSTSTSKLHQVQLADERNK